MNKNEKAVGDLSTNFWKFEFRCPCKKCRRKSVLVDGMLLFKAEMVRMKCGSKPMTINSGNRCLEENKKVGGHPNSAHIPMPRGKAIDARVKGVKPLNVGLAAEKVGGLRIGIGRTFVHLDVKLPCPSRFWIYRWGVPVYSAKINNKSLLKFYNMVMGKK